MRWFWIDQFIEFESGRRAVAVKNVSLAEDHIHEHFPGTPVMPNSLVLEGIAQTGGLLVGQYGDFLERVILAKVSRAKFHSHAQPGDTLYYTTEIHDIRDYGAMVVGASHRVTPGKEKKELQAEVELFFAHLNDTMNQELFDPANFLTMLRFLKLFDVARHPDGTKISVPAHLAQAERVANESASLTRR